MISDQRYLSLAVFEQGADIVGTSVGPFGVCSTFGNGYNRHKVARTQKRS
jgi:hypothetical protein